MDGILPSCLPQPAAASGVRTGGATSPDFVAVALRVLAELPGACRGPAPRGCGRRMHLRLGQVARHGLVGDEHELLDELVRDVVDDLLDAQRLPLSSSRTFTSGKSRFNAPCAKALRAAASPPASTSSSTPASARPSRRVIPSGQMPPCMSDGGRADDARRELHLVHGQLRCELDKRALRQAVLVRAEATEVVGKFLPATSAGPDPRGRRCCRATAPRGPTRCPGVT